MTREEAKKLLPVIQAFADGKTIQVRINNDSSWTDLLDNKLEISKLFEYSIKSEPKYRPFKTQEECWNEMLKHQPFGWIKNECGNIFNIIAIFKESIKLNERDNYYSECYKRFKFIDDTPFGIKEE